MKKKSLHRSLALNIIVTFLQFFLALSLSIALYKHIVYARNSSFPYRSHSLRLLNKDTLSFTLVLIFAVFLAYILMSR